MFIKAYFTLLGRLQTIVIVGVWAIRRRLLRHLAVIQADDFASRMTRRQSLRASLDITVTVAACRTTIMALTEHADDRRVRFLVVVTKNDLFALGYCRWPSVG